MAPNNFFFCNLFRPKKGLRYTVKKTLKRTKSTHPQKVCSGILSNVFMLPHRRGQSKPGEKGCMKVMTGQLKKPRKIMNLGRYTRRYFKIINVFVFREETVFVKNMCWCADMMAAWSTTKRTLRQHCQ